ncbi:MAG: I78 family peptidase inhibitor [Paracoccus sp. (in: a-proteobacteria)]
MTHFLKGAVLLAPLALMACEPVPETSMREAMTAEDACGSANYQNLVGQKSPAISLPAGTDYRQYRTGDPVTLDMRPMRINFEYDKSGTLIKVSCG